MNNKILLTAKPRTGKSRAIAKIIELVGLENCGGFYTAEIRENDERTGFEIKTLDGKSGVLASIDSDSEIRVSRYGVNIDTFERIALPSLAEALENKKVIIIDEIGPMQMYSEKYKLLLEEVIKSDKFLIGTVYYDSYPWIDEFKKNEGLTIVEMTLENRDEIPLKVYSLISNETKRRENQKQKRR